MVMTTCNASGGGDSNDTFVKGEKSLLYLIRYLFIKLPEQQGYCSFLRCSPAISFRITNASTSHPSSCLDHQCCV